MSDRVECQNCGFILNDGPPSPLAPVAAGVLRCPRCGSTIHDVRVNVGARAALSATATVQRAWNSDRLAVLLSLLALGPTGGLAIGFATGCWLLGIAGGFASMAVGAVALWFFLVGPLARWAMDTMARISGM